MKPVLALGVSVWIAESRGLLDSVSERINFLEPLLLTFHPIST
jgi:hypothetical protein